MLKRLAAPAVALVLGATTAIALPPGTALADCHEGPGGLVDCNANNSGGSGGSGGDNNSGGGGNGNANTATGNGCQNQGGGVPGAGCTGGAAAAQPNIPTTDWAEQARSLLQPPAPGIRWTPEPRTYVQLRTGLWLEPATFETLHATAGVAGETVTATAKPTQVEWDLVEATIPCKNAGSPDGTACGYTYQRSSADQPGGKYQITATAVYGVTWTCAGAGCEQRFGTLDDLRMPATAQLPVDEIQTESQPG